MGLNWNAEFAGQSVCVTGAGGYIGSAIVKALAAAGLRSLVLLDSSEYGLFEIQRWLHSNKVSGSFQCVLGSVSDERLLDDLLGRSHPQVVFHAAAFKHVGMLEENPLAALSNNSLGTYTCARAAARHGVSQFVLISTDKAVNPHSVMGLSKRIAELFALSTKGANVIRLGNVIGSPGSVLPLFLEQIERGEAISVTHPEASRYFLSRSEAVDAILAAALARSHGNVFLPEFREPMRIIELAKSLIGGRQLPIRLQGLKPGEKLMEDLMGQDEKSIGTIPGPLTVLQTRRLTRTAVETAVADLGRCIAERNMGELLEIVCTLVPEYVPSEIMQQYAVSV